MRIIVHCLLVVTDLKRELRRATKERSVSPPVSLPTSEAEQPVTIDPRSITANAPATDENGIIPDHQEESRHGQHSPTIVPSAVLAVDETAKAASNEPVLIEPSPKVVSVDPETPQQPDGGGPSALFKQHNLRLSSIPANQQGALEQVLREVGRPVDRKFCPTTFFILSNLAGVTGTYYHTEGAYDVQVNGTFHTENLHCVFLLSKTLLLY